jgi:hypothetical protein
VTLPISNSPPAELLSLGDRLIGTNSPSVSDVKRGNRAMDLRSRPIHRDQPACCLRNEAAEAAIEARDPIDGDTVGGIPIRLPFQM